MTTYKIELSTLISKVREAFKDSNFFNGIYTLENIRPSSISLNAKFKINTNG